MLNLLAAFGGAYFATLVIAAFVLVVVDYFRDGVALETDELMIYALLWPIVVCGMIVTVARRAPATARRAYTGAVANTGGLYWTVRGKLPF